eukprot:SAG31_NODE_2770_length_5116_cov_3.834164_3_plen_102_part_00
MLGGIRVVGDAAGLAGGAASKAAELGGSVVGTLGSLKGKAMESSILKDGVGGTFSGGSYLSDDPVERFCFVVPKVLICASSIACGKRGSHTVGCRVQLLEY